MSASADGRVCVSSAHGSLVTEVHVTTASVNDIAFYVPDANATTDGGAPNWAEEMEDEQATTTSKQRRTRTQQEVAREAQRMLLASLAIACDDTNVQLYRPLAVGGTLTHTLILIVKFRATNSAHTLSAVHRSARLPALDKVYSLVTQLVVSLYSRTTYVHMHAPRRRIMHVWWQWPAMVRCWHRSTHKVVCVCAALVVRGW